MVLLLLSSLPFILNYFLTYFLSILPFIFLYFETSDLIQLPLSLSSSRQQKPLVYSDIWERGTNRVRNEKWEKRGGEKEREWQREGGRERKREIESEIERERRREKESQRERKVERRREKSDIEEWSVVEFPPLPSTGCIGDFFGNSSGYKLVLSIDD